MLRDAVLDMIAGEVEAIMSRPIVRVAVDGVDGAGKTFFANELAARIRRPVIRASTDAFHHPRAVRYAKGKHSPEGFFEDSFNYPKLKERLLDPLSSNPPENYCCEFFDHRKDAEVVSDWKEPPEHGVLIFDGIFAHRPELREYWDYSIFLEVSPAVSVRRCILREGLKDVPDDPKDVAHARYVGGQSIYLATCDPSSRCTRHIVNEEIDSPRVVA